MMTLSLIRLKTLKNKIGDILNFRIKQYILPNYLFKGSEYIMHIVTSKQSYLHFIPLF